MEKDTTPPWMDIPDTMLAETMSVPREGSITVFSALRTAPIVTTAIVSSSSLYAVDSAPSRRVAWPGWVPYNLERRENAASSGTSRAHPVPEKHAQLVRRTSLI